MVNEQKILKNKIDAAIDKTNRKLLADQLTWLKKTSAALPLETAEAWSITINELQQELDSLALGDQTAFHDLTGRTNTAVAALKLLKDVRAEEDEGLSPDFDMSTKDMRVKNGKLTNVPDITLRSIEAQVASAGTRLRVFTLITYAVAVILLALAGYVELYVTRSNFGSNNVADYFGLLAWGFGAEATRAAITDMVQSWGIVRK